jgi:hypothetical protein
VYIRTDILSPSIKCYDWSHDRSDSRHWSRAGNVVNYLVLSQKPKPDISMMQPAQNSAGRDRTELCGCRKSGAFLSNERCVRTYRNRRRNSPERGATALHRTPPGDRELSGGSSRRSIVRSSRALSLKYAWRWVIVTTDCRICIHPRHERLWKTCAASVDIGIARKYFR